MRLARRGTLLVAILVLLLAGGAALLAALPEIVRRVAVDQLARFTGRAVTLEDVDLNVFTGRAALKGFRLAGRDGGEPALTIERLDAQVAMLSLLAKDIHVTELALTAPTVRVARTGPAEFDFSDILARIPPADPRAPPTRTVTLERLTVRRATLVARDLAVMPEQTWRVEDLTVDLAGLTTREGAPPARLAAALKLNGTPVTVAEGAFTLKPLAGSARVAVEGLDLAGVRPYVPATMPAAPRAGRVSVALSLAVEPGAEAPKRVAVAGDVLIEGLEVVQRDRTLPFVTLPRLAVRIKEADLVARTVTVAAVEVERLALRATRDAQGTIDLLALAGTAAAPPAGAAAPGGPAPAPAAPAGPPLRLAVDQVTLREATFTFVDHAVAPVTTLALTGLTATVRDLTWPGAGPARLEATMTLPAGGRLDAKATVTVAPFDAEIALSMRNAPIEPYGAYFPIPARFAGRFNGDSRSRVTIANGAITATSKGTSWIDGLEVRAPGEATPPARVERVRLDGIDFAWPRHARVATVTITRPDVRIERGADGAITLRTLFQPAGTRGAGGGGGPPASVVPSPGAPPAAPAPRLPLVLEFGAIVIEDGYARFLDRTTTPAFSETVSKLALRLEGLSSEPGRRARLATRAVIGGGATLDLRGELAPLGELYADLVGELRDFALPSVNPYADSVIAWFIRTGTLGVRVHYRIEKDQLAADNEIAVRNLTVAPSRESDEVKKKVGLPLGLIVALVTDAENSIKFNVPLSGPLAQWRVGLGDAIWAAVKNALVNIVAAPFRAIGRLFKGKSDTVEELRVEPVTFAAASAVVAPAMERHLTQVADFLRRAPLVRFVLAPVAAGPDLDLLREQEVTARLERIRRERGLADLAAAVAADFRDRLPGETPPATLQERLALLRRREPVPAARVAELQARRLDTVRERLTKAEGIPADRLAAGDAATAGEAADGRVEFRIAH